MINDLKDEKSKLEASLKTLKDEESASKNTRLTLEGENKDLKESMMRLQKQLADAEATIKQLRAEKEQQQRQTLPIGQTPSNSFAPTQPTAFGRTPQTSQSEQNPSI